MRQLADWGADVIKIEQPSDAPDAFGARHGSDFQNLHRNKKSLTLNLKEPQGLEIFNKLVANADVGDCRGQPRTVVHVTAFDHDVKWLLLRAGCSQQDKRQAKPVRWAPGREQ